MFKNMRIITSKRKILNLTGLGIKIIRNQLSTKITQLTLGIDKLAGAIYSNM